MKRKIAVVTTSRADYGHLYWPLRELSQHPAVDLKILALGPHLSPEFGKTIEEIERDGFEIAAGSSACSVPIPTLAWRRQSEWRR